MKGWTPEDIYRMLSEKYPEYPCRYCSNEGRARCGMISCYRWMNWFGVVWRDIRRTFSRYGDRIVPVELHRTSKGIVALRYGKGNRNLRRRIRSQKDKNR